MGSIPGSGRSLGEGHGNPLHISCLKNPMDRGACGLQSMGLQRNDGSKESDTTEQLSTAQWVKYYFQFFYGKTSPNFPNQLEMDAIVLLLAKFLKTENYYYIYPFSK